MDHKVSTWIEGSVAVEIHIDLGLATDVLSHDGIGAKERSVGRVALECGDIAGIMDLMIGQREGLQIDLVDPVFKGRDDVLGRDFGIAQHGVDEMICAASTRQRIVADSTNERVVSEPAIDVVVAASARDRIIAAAGGDDVGGRTRIDRQVTRIPARDKLK